MASCHVNVNGFCSDAILARHVDRVRHRRAIQPGRVLAMVTRTTTGSPAGGPSRLHLLSFPPTSERSKTATMIRETRSVARRTIYDRATKRSLGEQRGPRRPGGERRALAE